LVAAKMDLEIGWLAWGIGAGVGYAFRQGGGRGPAGALLCSALALVSIFGGKYGGAAWALADVRGQVPAPTRDGYDEFMEDARLAEGIRTEGEIRRFMVERGFADAGPAAFIDEGSESSLSSIPDEEVVFFERRTLPWLHRLRTEKPTFEQWAAAGGPGAVLDDLSLTEAVIDGLGAVDLVFIVLGAASAFALAAGQVGGRRPARRHGRRIEPAP
ncbi:MAG: hypothetical protein ACE5JG_04365, partial [Planctomycetota bacterium]